MEDKESEISEEKDSDSTMNAIPKKELMKKEMLKKSTSPPFPQALHGKKGIRNAAEILEVLRQVKVNIPLLDMIKQVPTYAKFLKDLCTIKRGLAVNKKAFLIEQDSYALALMQIGNLRIGSSRWGCNYGDACFPNRALKWYIVRKKWTSGSLPKVRKKTAAAVLFASLHFACFSSLLLFACARVSTLKFKPEANLVPIILGRPFLATSNAIINYRNGLMQLTFGNMTLDLNIFYMSKKQITLEEEEGPEELCIIDTLVEEHCNQNMQDKLNESLVDFEEGLSKSPTVLATLQSWRKIEEILPLFNKEEEAAAKKELQNSI
ncbi:hypothetical protein CK203_109058 [Vitis vinifera]|uniref:Uncharacterized protein n=1 Tax=Vitis vinifera TaxID=29760 RepID=A0A438C5F9_VITVI|nr:hypothetical protein CK203_109058 [Vitis vinifera]